MTRARKPAGRIVFVGAGPGDPGLLTMRAAQALDAASLVVTDPDVPADIIALAGEAEVKPAVGEPAEVAKTLVAAARTGQSVVRLVAGDVLTADPVVKELQSVARSAVPFDVIPGLSATAVASYSGIAVGSVHTVADVRSTSDWRRLAAAPGTLLLQASSGHLADTARSLAQSGLAGGDPGVGDLGRHPAHPADRRRHAGDPGRHRQRHDRAAGGHRRRRHRRSGTGCPGGSPARCTAGGC